MTGDNFKFKDIPAPSTPDEARIVELVRLVVREENARRDEVIIVAARAVVDALGRFRNPRGVA